VNHSNLEPTSRYRGRFAPTPSGPLHFGSLIAALGSYLEARRRGGDWLVRIEDLDPPRAVPGAADLILRTLEAFGFHWDGEVVYQSRRSDAYGAALAQLRASGTAYRCGCSRKQIAAAGLNGPAGPIYPGSCRGGTTATGPTAWRVDTSGARIAFDDAVQGRIAVDLERDIGDFVVRRADGLYAYHLASVVDDADAGITAVVRGQDLLICTAPQIFLQGLLGLPTPTYLHLPLALNRQGQKLSKQTYAPALDTRRRAGLLAEALRFLGHPPPDDCAADLETLWQWAVLHWDAARIPRENKAVDTSG
jgi:glutamyl-Q tRNA(Asp) synthetase